MNQGWRLGALTLVALAMVFVPAHSAPVQGPLPPLAMLGRLEPGNWEIHSRMLGATVERICIRDGRRLIQLRHSGVICQQLVVEDKPGAVTVQYSCQGKGYGRTQIRQETPKLVQIKSQGIADGLPFEFAAEARWVGTCDG